MDGNIRREDREACNQSRAKVMGKVIASRSLRLTTMRRCSGTRRDALAMRSPHKLAAERCLLAVTFQYLFVLPHAAKYPRIIPKP